MTTLKPIFKDLNARTCTLPSPVPPDNIFKDLTISGILISKLIIYTNKEKSHFCMTSLLVYY